MRRDAMIGSPRTLRLARQRGLTLVELMVALTIGLFLTLGLMLMMSDSSRTFKIQDDYARMQENAVSSLRYVADSLRHTGFFGHLAITDTLELFGAIGTIDAPNCGNAFTTNVPLFGYSGLTPASVTGTVPCIASANFQAGPVLITRLATGTAVADSLAPLGFLTAELAAIAATTPHALYVQTGTGNGTIFRAADYGSLTSSPRLQTYPNGHHAPVFPYQMHVYYIRPCSRPAGATCSATDDSGRPIPTLVRQEIETYAGGNRWVERPLAEGVERLGLLYGLDLNPAPNGDGIADRYVADPLTVSPDGWTRVVSIRVTLLVRSPTVISGYDDSSKNYDLNGDGVADFNCNDVVATEPQACAYKRALFSQVLQVRNVAFRRGA
jgi:type IV pilus assembly protein PilW